MEAMKKSTIDRADFFEKKIMDEQDFSGDYDVHVKMPGKAGKKYKLTEMGKTMFPIEFVEWIRASESLNPMLNDWICDRITTDKLYYYWLINIKNKQNENTD